MTNVYKILYIRKPDERVRLVSRNMLHTSLSIVATGLRQFTCKETMRIFLETSVGVYNLRRLRRRQYTDSKNRQNRIHLLELCNVPNIQYRKNWQSWKNLIFFCLRCLYPSTHLSMPLSLPTQFSFYPPFFRSLSISNMLWPLSLQSFSFCPTRLHRIRR
jgi:hypothetical protein